MFAIIQIPYSQSATFTFCRLMEYYFLLNSLRIEIVFFYKNPKQLDAVIIDCLQVQLNN